MRSGCSAVSAPLAKSAATDQLLRWFRQADLEIAVDRIGNIFGLWRDAGNADKAPVLVGSHADTVINAGICSVIQS